jgi:small-conductance mechanosensitive channel
MPEWLASRLPEWVTAWHLIVFSIVLAVSMAAVSAAIVGVVLARLPADFFVNPHAQRPIDRHPVLKAILVGVRNFFGYVLILLGILLSLPGVPGQGLLTILMGVMLIDFPGKRRVLRWLVSREAVLRNVNRLRAKAGQPPLLVELAPPDCNGHGDALNEGKST